MQKYEKKTAQNLNKHNVPGPANYNPKEVSSAPIYSFGGSRFDVKREPMHKKADGSRFDSSLLAKPHLKPKKVDGPGPGDYVLHSSIK